MRESGKISSPFEQRINCVSTSMLRLCLWLHECKWMTELQFLSVSSKRFISDPLQYHLTPVSSITLLLSYDRCNSITFCFFKTAVSLEHSFPKFHSTLSKLSLRLDVTHWHSQRVGLSIRLVHFYLTAHPRPESEHSNIAVITDSDWGGECPCLARVTVGCATKRHIRVRKNQWESGNMEHSVCSATPWLCMSLCCRSGVQSWGHVQHVCCKKKKI